MSRGVTIKVRTYNNIHYNIHYSHTNLRLMKITIENDGFIFTRTFEEHPSAEEAVFASLYLLTKIYPTNKIKEGLIEVVEDI